MNLILASKSPRRREILSSLGVDFDIVSADADELIELPSQSLPSPIAPLGVLQVGNAPS